MHSERVASGRCLVFTELAAERPIARINEALTGDRTRMVRGRGGELRNFRESQF